MNLEPLLNSEPVIVIHVVAAVAALVTGAFVLARRKGTPLHKRFGKIWIALMLVVTISSFFIHEIRTWGLFSPIHLLSVFSLFSMYVGIRAARGGRMSAHRNAMRGLYFGGLVIAGAFSFMPGRIMHRMVFAETSPGGVGPMVTLALVFAGVGTGLMVLKWLERREKNS